MDFKEIVGTLDVKRKELKKLFEANQTGTFDEKGLPIFNSKLLDTPEYVALSAEVTGLTKQFNQATEAATQYANLVEAEKAARAPGNMLGANDSKASRKSVGQALVETARFKEFTPGAGKSIGMELKDINIKTLLTTTGGFPPFVDRTGEVVPYPLRAPVVADLLPQMTTTENAIKYMAEQAFTNASAFVAEGGAYPESALAWLEVTTPISKIATFIPVTEEQIADVPNIMDLIDNRLIPFLLVYEDGALLTGTGSAPQITGFLNASGLITQAQGNDDAFTAFLKAIELVQTANNTQSNVANPTGFVMHPKDVLSLRLIKDGLGRFILGGPETNQQFNLWGLPVAVTTGITQGTTLTGDFQKFSKLWRRTGVSLEVGYVNDDFIKGRQSIRVQERIALEIGRGNAFAQITGVVSH